MSFADFIEFFDYTPFRHLRGPEIVDVHGFSVGLNFCQFTVKLFRLNIAQRRGKFDSPFEEFRTTHRRFMRLGRFRINVGDLANDHTHAFDSFMKHVLLVLGYSGTDYYYQDEFDSECKLEYLYIMIAKPAF